MPLPSRLMGVTLALSLVACHPSVNTQRKVVGEVVDEQPARREAFEATLRVLDEHPEYVDEFFAQLLEHPPAMNRFLAINASGLDDPQYAALMARHLVRHPEPLTETMVQVLIAGKDKPESQRAMALSMEQQPELTARTVTSRPESVSAVTRALVGVLREQPEARQAFLAALQERKAEVAELLLSDPKALTALMGELARRGADDDKVAALLRELAKGLTGVGGGGREEGDAPLPGAPPPPKK
jgi:CRP-like cAMP-binding protein